MSLRRRVLSFAMAVAWTALPVFGQTTIEHPIPLPDTRGADWAVVFSDGSEADVAISSIAQEDGYGETASFLALSISFDAGTDWQIATFYLADAWDRVAGVPHYRTGEPAGRLRRFELPVYGFNTNHVISLLFVDDSGGIHELVGGSLDFDGWRELLGMYREPSDRNLQFVGFSVVALPDLVPRNRDALVLLGELNLELVRSREVDDE